MKFYFRLATLYNEFVPPLTKVEQRSNIIMKITTIFCIKLQESCQFLIHCCFGMILYKGVLDDRVLCLICVSTLD